MARRGSSALLAVALTASLVPSAVFADGGVAQYHDVKDAPALAQAGEQAPVELAARAGVRRAAQVAPQAMTARAVHDAQAAFAPRGEVHAVASLAEFDAAVEQIAASEAAEATIQLSADLYAAQNKAGKPFVGVPGKTVMLSSVDGARHSVYLGSELAGGLVLDNVSTEIVGNTIYANAHRFETTDRYAGAMSFLYGGGSVGNDVSGDCDIVLRGGYVAKLYGGGRDSNVDGDVRITIDAPVAPGSLPAHSAGLLHGGGHALKTDQGRVSGDVTIDFRSGSNGEFYGGGNNEFDRDPAHVSNPAAMVSGTVTVNFGYKGAPARSVWPGTAMYSYAGSEYSTVGNVRLNLLDGCSDCGDREFFGCGLSDTVLGTVEIVVEGNVDLDSGYIRYGGDVSPGEYYASGNVSILNQGKAEHAVRVRWNTPLVNADGSAWVGVQGSQEDVPLTIEGDVLVDIESGYLAFVKLDSETSSAIINGDSTVRLSGNSKVAQIQGNEAEYGSKEEQHKTAALIDGAEATVGYFYNFDEVRITDGSEVLVDGGSEVFPMFGSDQKPFYAVKDLVVNAGSSVTTRNSDTQVRRNVVMDHGTWHAKGRTYVYEAMDTRDSSILWDTYYQVGYNHRNENDPSHVMAWKSEGDTFVGGYNRFRSAVYGNVQAKGGTWSLLSRTSVNGNFAADGLALQLPVIAEGANYPAGSIPLAIGGVSSGHADVVTVGREGLAEDMDASAWTGRPVVPTLTENYITSWAPKGVGTGDGQDDPAQAVFTLAAGVRGEDDYFLKRLPDADDQYADEYYMWQVADGFAVTFDKNNDDEGSTDADPARMSIPSNPGDAVALGALPGEPTRPGYVFDGWYANVEGTGDPVTAATMVDGDVTFYAKWSVAPAPEPEPENHTVTFIDRVPGHEDRVVEVEHGKTCDRPADPVRAGFAFGGWFLDPECTVPFDFSTAIVEDVVLYGKWTPELPGGGGEGGTTPDPDGGEGTVPAPKPEPAPSPAPKPEPAPEFKPKPEPAPEFKPGSGDKPSADKPAPALPATGDVMTPLAAAGMLTGASSLIAGVVSRKRRDRAE